MINTSDAPLRYLCFSTMVAPDVMVHPDSNKVLKADAEVGYYEGEES